MTALLASLDGVEVVAEAATGQAALREAQLSPPDVVVMDIQMPEMDGRGNTRCSTGSPGARQRPGRRRSGTLRAADGRPLEVTVDAPDRLPQLPAAVELAACRVAVEAVTNIARHSEGATARLTLTLCDAVSLRATVSDTGRRTEPWTPGVGIQSMHERVEQIGGTLTIHLPLALPA